MISFEQKTPPEITSEIASRVRKRRKELRLTQAQMASKAGMSLASYKRFEQKGLIALDSLVKIAIACGCESDFDELFAKRQYLSIQEVIDERAASKRREAHR